MKSAIVILKELSDAILSLALASLILYILWRASTHKLGYLYSQSNLDTTETTRNLLPTILPALGRSALLIALAFIISIFLTLISSAFKYRFRYHPFINQLFSASLYFISAIPVAFAAYYLIFAFKHHGISLIHPSTFSDFNSPSWVYYIIPALTLAVGDDFLSEAFRHTEEEIISARRQYHLIMAKSRGETIWLDVIKEILIRVFRIFSSRLVSLFSGSVIVEFIFKLPGAGSLAFDAAETRNLAILIVLLWSAMAISIFLNFSYRSMIVILDPRQR